jgi:hypothetical protein
MIADEACWERGCACHDSRDSPGVELVKKREWVGLTEDEKTTAIWTDGGFGAGALWAETKLKEKNT